MRQKETELNKSHNIMQKREYFVILAWNLGFNV